MDNLESFDSIAIYTMQIPTKEQNILDVKEEKAKDVENLVKLIFLRKGMILDRNRLDQGGLYPKREGRWTKGTGERKVSG